MLLYVLCSYWDESKFFDTVAPTEKKYLQKLAVTAENYVSEQQVLSLHANSTDTAKGGSLSIESSYEAQALNKGINSTNPIHSMTNKSERRNRFSPVQCKSMRPPWQPFPVPPKATSFDVSNNGSKTKRPQRKISSPKLTLSFSKDGGSVNLPKEETRFAQKVPVLATVTQKAVDVSFEEIDTAAHRNCSSMHQSSLKRSVSYVEKTVVNTVSFPFRKFHSVVKSATVTKTSSVQSREAELYRRKLAHVRHVLKGWGCLTPEEHLAKLEKLCAIGREGHGEDGLGRIGFAYKRVHSKSCSCDFPMDFDGAASINVEEGPTDDGASSSVCSFSSDDDFGCLEHGDVGATAENSIFSELESTLTGTTRSVSTLASGVSGVRGGSPSQVLTRIDRGTFDWGHDQCMTRLFHVKSSSPITDANRKDFIADGEMYEIVARLCQEYAQERMIADGNLEWITICDDSKRGEPIRALVDKVSQTDDHTEMEARRTLLIATGKGKVRAGIFSRKHLLTTGIEPSTAIPLVQEAKRRNLRVVILDPNARGDRLGMETFEKSMDKIFGRQRSLSKICETEGSCKASNINGETRKNGEITPLLEELYVIAHSAAGAQFVRYLLDKKIPLSADVEENDLNAMLESDVPVDTPRKHRGLARAKRAEKEETRRRAAESRALQPTHKATTFRIEAVAFTDSTHNIQWTKNNLPLCLLLQSNKSLYLKSAHADDFEPERVHASLTGKPVCSDRCWEHRFGHVRTLWAGTKIHELTNWTARKEIWDHFDTQNNGESC